MYIPKNRIKTNLYTPGGVFVIKQTGENYTGHYHQLYTNRFFTGKTPNEKPTRELIQLSANTNAEWDIDASLPEGIKTIQRYSFNYDGEFTNKSENSFDNIDRYHFLKEVDISQVKYLPQQKYPSPTENDYKLGVFPRYFCVKNNEDVYIEIDKDTYDKLVQQNSNWSWELYTPFDILWTITGVENEVKQTNENMVLLQERRSKRDGLQLFLRKNYLKFYRPDLETQS
jgi:hypothetical protein